MNLNLMSQNISAVTGREVTITKLVVAGWTGRDRAAMEAHVRELGELGVPAPATMPMFYEISPSRLTAGDTIVVIDDDTSGEAECVYLSVGDDIWLGLGSDHTDRKLETVSVTLSKQVCDKPVGNSFWKLSDVEKHFDELVLRSWITEAGSRNLYQEGRLANLRNPVELIEEFRRRGGRFEHGSAMFGGTLAALGAIRPSKIFEMELHDPVLNRSISHAYSTVALAPVG